MNGWFQHKPTIRFTARLPFFRDISIRNAALLMLSLSLNGACRGQDKATAGFALLSNDHCSLQITGYSGNTMSLRYNTLPGNQAGQNFNSLWLYRSSQVPWNAAPLSMVNLPETATQSGSYVIGNISIAVYTSYIACYSVDSTNKQICACSLLSGLTDSITNSFVDISLQSVSSNALAFSYKTLAGYLPKTYGNWFGLWEGIASPYNYYPPIAQGTPPGNASTGNAALNNLSLESGQNYTLVYFMNANPNSAAVIITFVVQ